MRVMKFSKLALGQLFVTRWGAHCRRELHLVGDTEVLVAISIETGNAIHVENDDIVVLIPRFFMKKLFENNFENVKKHFTKHKK